MQQMGAFIDDDTAGLEEGLEDAKKQLTNVDDYIINIEENEWLGEFLKKKIAFVWQRKIRRRQIITTYCSQKCIVSL